MAASIIGGERQRNIALVMIDEPAQVLHAPHQIGKRIVRIGDAQHGGGFRHQLHKSHGTGGRCGGRGEARLLRDDRTDEFRVEAEPRRVFIDPTLNR